MKYIGILVAVGCTLAGGFAAYYHQWDGIPFLFFGVVVGAVIFIKGRSLQ